jgi:hypothetical protein
MGLPYLYLPSQINVVRLTRHSNFRWFIPTLSKVHNDQCDFIIIYTLSLWIVFSTDISWRVTVTDNAGENLEDCSPTSQILLTLTSLIHNVYAPNFENWNTSVLLRCNTHISYGCNTFLFSVCGWIGGTKFSSKTLDKHIFLLSKHNTDKCLILESI